MLILFLAAFIPRAVYPVSRPLQWYERSFRFIDAVLHGRWADTVVSEHPGVTPMWLIGLAQHGTYALLKALGASPRHPLDIADRAFQTEVAISILPLALAIALGILLTWRLLRNLFGEPVAWAGAGFLALDPFHIAISKVVHVDALLSMLMVLSALTLLEHLRRSNVSEPGRSFWVHYRLLLASGVLAGLAFLTKSPAYFLVPFFGLSLLVTHGTRNPQHATRQVTFARDYLVPLLLWGGAAAVTYVALWPAMWVQPGQTLATVLGGVIKHTGRAHPQPLYYLGELTTEDPGPGFYGLTLLVKTTILSLPLFVVGLIGPLTDMWRRERRSLALLIAYCVFFFVQMSLGAKKDPRYLLPAFPVLDVLAGVGLVTLARRLGRLESLPHVPASAFVAAALLVQAVLVWPYHPYYVTYASPLVGGPAGAQRLLLASPESEGLDLVADYLNRLPQAQHLRVGVQLPAREAFRQYFVGEVADTREPDLDYLVFAEVYVRRHMAEDQWGEQWETYKYRRPEYTAYLHGLPYAWIYRVAGGPQQPAVPQQVCLGEHVRLLGYTLITAGASPDGRVVHPGELLRLTLHWAATGTPDGDYSVFVHLLGPDGKLVTQQDNPPLHGTYPTFLWKSEERLDDPYELTIPPDAPPGSYSLATGMYDWRTGERLTALANCTTPLPDNRITLATFSMQPERVWWWEVAAWILAGALAVGGLVVARPKIALLYTGLGPWWMPLAYLLLTLVMTYPAVFRLSTHYIGSSTDLWVFPWGDWWGRKCLLEWHSPFFTTRLFYPNGVSTVYHNFAWLNTAMWLPLSPLVGPIAAHNMIFLFNLALGGIGMHLLVHYLTKDQRAAFIAGLIFTFWPYRMSQWNHPNTISVGWIPLCMLFLIRMIREKPRLKFALLAGLFLALTGLARWLLLLLASGLILIYLVYSMVFERRYWSRHTIVALVLMLGLAGTLMAPLLSPLIITQIRGGEQAEAITATREHAYGTDLVSYFIPPEGHLFFRTWLGNLWGRMGRGACFGYVALALAGVGLVISRRERVPWLVTGTGLFVLALGYDLQIAGRYLNVSLPCSWIRDWPVMDLVRHPYRFNILLSLPLAVLAGYGATWLLSRSRRATMWTLGLSVLILIEYLPLPYPTIPPDVPLFYQELAHETDDFAILDLPLGTSTAAKLYMYYSTIHGKALVGGRVARLPRSAYAFIDSVPLLHGLHTDDEMDFTLCDVSRQLSILVQSNVRYIVLHPDWVTPDRLARWREWLAVPPIYEDQRTVVYRTELRYGRDFQLSEIVGDSIGMIDSTVTLSQDRTLEVKAVWGSTDAPTQDWEVRVALTASSGLETQLGNFIPCAGWPTGQWGKNAVTRGHSTLEIPASVESGTYTVTLTLVDAVTGISPARPLAVGQVEIQDERP